LRPYIFECLEEANKLFQVGVFTASHKSYADAILDFIDPENKLFSFRLYRDSCLKTPDGYYVKDLRIFQDRALSDLVLIDNSVYSFAYQIENGVPIIPFYHDKNDEELFHLITYMQGVSLVDDVRTYNREAFGLTRLAEEVANESSVEDEQSSCEDEYQMMNE
jgi:CTD small phosphatase-like protein 2